MKKAYAMLLGCMGLMLFVNNKAQAQLQKGNMLIGADLMGMSADFQSGNTTFNLSLNPKVAWFIRDNVAIGGMVNLGLTTGDGFTTFSYGVSALGRYYISDPQTQLLRQSRFFLEGQVGIMGQNNKVDGAPNTSTNGLGVGFGPGIAYFITPNISLEGLLKYNLTVGFGNSTTNNQVAFGLGFQIYLPTKKAREVYNDARSQMK